MAAAKKTNWAAILIVIGVVFVVWLLLTRKAAAGGSSGGGGLVGGGGSGYPLGQQQQQPQGGGGLSAGFPGSGGVPANASTLSSFLGGWLSNVLNTGYANAATLQIDNGYEPGGALDGLTIPDEPLALFDVNQLATDIPDYSGATDTSGLDTIDTNISDGFIDDSGDSSGLGLIDTNITDGSIADNSFTSFNDDNYDYGGDAEQNLGLNQGFA